MGAGTVRISVPSVEGKDAVFNVLGKGEIFGEIALLDGNPRTADATAVTDCELFVIERRDFLPLIREESEIALRLIEILCSKLRRTTEQAEEVMFLDLPSRLAKALMRLEADTACTGERKISITQRDLGNIIGMSRESTNKQLRIWQGKKWVRLERNAVVILATDSLAAIGELGAHSA
jgi:CRP-like cAMP-binding protein